MVDISTLLNDEKTLLIFEHIPVEVHVWQIVYDDAGEIETWKLVYANPPAIQSWEQSGLANIKGMTTDDIFGEGSTEHYMHVVKTISQTGCPYTFQDYFPNIGKHFQFTSVPLENYFITTGSDITELVENQDIIKHKNKELESRVKRRTQELEQTVSSLHSALEESKRLREEMKQLAIKDPLTGLYNRRHMEEELEREITRSNRNNSKLSLMFIDIDNFKEINDTYGHEAGDVALQEMATMIKRKLRGNDIVCRFGGDEIVVILPDTSLTLAIRKAKELSDSIADIDWKNYSHALAGITLSFGIAESPTNAVTGQELLNKADSALLIAKDKGRNRIEPAL